MTNDDERGLVRQALADCGLPPTTDAPEPFEGLAVGISTEDLSLPKNTVRISTEQLTIMRAFERVRTLRALESLDETAELTLAAQQRIAQASERTADALETLVALFASCIGQSYAWCPGSKPNETPSVNFIRSSGDGAPFKCGGADQTDENNSD